MSGSISAPMGNAPMAAGAQPGMGQMPPQLLAMLLQAAQRQQGGGPAQMQSPGPMQAQMPQVPPPQTGMAQPMGGVAQVPGTADRGMPASYPGSADRGGIPQPIPGSYMGSATPTAPSAASMPVAVSGAAGAQQMMPNASQQQMMSRMMGQMGRNGDSMMAHMTPGEIAVPPQVQTPQLLAMLSKAFGQAGVSPQQFTAGSPFASQNPQTGNQEFSLWSALLPVLGAVGGSLVAPGVGTAIGGALGGAAGGAIDHTGVGGILGGAAGGGIGGYLGGGGGLSSLIGSGADAAASGAAGAAANGVATGAAGAGAAASTAPLGAAAPTSIGTAAGAAGNAGGGLFDGPPVVTPGSQGIVPGGNLPIGQPAASPSLAQYLKGGLGAGLGATLGSGLGQSFNSAPSALPPGFSTPMPAPNPNMPIAGRTAGASPTFSGYSPYASVTGGGTYNFYPTT